MLVVFNPSFPDGIGGYSANLDSPDAKDFCFGNLIPSEEK
jgi:hypothetical protein